MEEKTQVYPEHSKKDKVVHIRLQQGIYNLLEGIASTNNYDSVSKYVRQLIYNVTIPFYAEELVRTKAKMSKDVAKETSKMLFRASMDFLGLINMYEYCIPIMQKNHQKMRNILERLEMTRQKFYEEYDEYFPASSKDTEDRSENNEPRDA